MTEATNDLKTETLAEEINLEDYREPAFHDLQSKDSTYSDKTGEMKAVGYTVDAPIDKILLRLDVSSIELQRHIRRLNDRLSGPS